MPNIIASAEAENKGELYTTQLQVHQHTFVADELPELGGKDAGPAPGDYLCAALASCTAITLRMYVGRKQWAVDVIRVKVDLVKGTEMPSGNNTFLCQVSVQGALDEEQQKRLMDIAKACPIHRLLGKPSDMVTELVKL